MTKPTAPTHAATAETRTAVKRASEEVIYFSVYAPQSHHTAVKRASEEVISLFMLLSHITLLDLACCLHCLTLLVGSASEASTCNK